LDGLHRLLCATGGLMAEDFALANKAFDLMTLQERRFVLEQFSRLRYPSIADRFFEAVHSVIRERYDEASGFANHNGLNDQSRQKENIVPAQGEEPR
jgi:hypothetical protein